MPVIVDTFGAASLQEIKQGYSYQPDTDEFICLVCGERFDNGVIYPADGQLFEAKKYVQLHITKTHQSVFNVLLNLDKKFTGLTDHQKRLLELLHSGRSDQQATAELNAGSTSTIRNHRFALRERQKQAKFFLAIMELLAEKTMKNQTGVLANPSSSAQEQEETKIVAAYFKQGPNGPLALYPVKEKKRIAIIRQLANRFDIGKTYTEQEVNEILKPVYDDYVLLRRHLIDFGFMERTRDGSAYWLKQSPERSN
jgi:hypothetical protein